MTFYKSAQRNCRGLQEWFGDMLNCPLLQGRAYLSNDYF
uniref:Uncharacterized protein n=1 Tax=Anguilla anguilla TaxID=7936 RepID=A0A0E9SCY5_ANGAN